MSHRRARGRVICLERLKHITGNAGKINAQHFDEDMMDTLGPDIVSLVSQ
jgi:hypothetical protein